MRPRRAPRAGRAAQATLEFAVVVPLFLICLLGALDAGLWALQTSAEVSAVEQAATVAASAGSNPAAETAPDARAVTAAVSGQLRTALFGTSIAGWCQPVTTGACQPDVSARCPSTPAEVQATMGPRAVVVCVTEQDPPPCVAPPSGVPSPYPPKCDEFATDHRARDRFHRILRASRIRSRSDRFRASHRHFCNDAHAAVRTVTRRGRRGDDAQAVLETALILPILLLLVCNFVGLMVQVTVQQQLNAATALAAQSRFQAPEQRGGSVGNAVLRCRRIATQHRGTPDRMPLRSRDLLRDDDDVHGHARLADRTALHVRRRQR